MTRPSRVRLLTNTRAAIPLAAVLFALTSVLAPTSVSGQMQRDQAASAPVTRGTLLIVGGGTQPDDLVRHFIDLAGGAGKARIAILPMASSDAAATGADKEAQLDSLGADSFVVVFDRAHADDDSIVRKLSGVTGIWFPGGDQSPLAAALRGSAALRMIQALRVRGGHRRDVCGCGRNERLDDHR